MAAGQQNTYFNFWAITGWLVTALWQAAVIMVLVLLGCSSTTIAHKNGMPFTM
jgi:hypothetical protein